MKNTMNGFEIKKRLVLEGKSEIFAKWQELVPSLTVEEFIENLEWLCADTRENDDGSGRLTREIGLTTKGIVKIKRVNGWMTIMYRLDTHERWMGDWFVVPCIEKFVKNADNAIKMGYADENGKIRLHYKISLSCADRI